MDVLNIVYQFKAVLDLKSYRFFYA